MPTRIITLGDRRVAVDADSYARFHAFGAQLAPRLADGARNARDAGEGLAFVISQLAYTESNVYSRQYTPMQYETLVPVSSEAGEWAQSIRYEIEDHQGRGKRSNGKGRDINLVSVAYGAKDFGVFNGDIGYDYNMEELRVTAFLRRPVSESKQVAAVEGYRRHMNQVALLGEPESNITGLFNSTLVPQGNAPTGNWSTSATPQQMLRDLNAGIMQVWTQTNFNEMVTDVVIAPTAYGLLTSLPRSDNSDKTVLSYLLENNIAKMQRDIDLNIQPGYGLDTAGIGGTKRAVYYVNNPLKLKMHIPLPLRFLAPQMIGLAVQVPGEYKYSGVTFYYPKSAYYQDGL